MSEVKSNGESLGLGWSIYDAAFQLGLSLTGYEKYYLFSLERVILTYQYWSFRIRIKSLLASLPYASSRVRYGSPPDNRTNNRLQNRPGFKDLCLGEAC